MNKELSKCCGFGRGTNNFDKDECSKCSKPFIPAEEKVCDDMESPCVQEGKRYCDPECNCQCHPRKPSPSSDSMEGKPLDRFYALYEEGRKKEKAPQGYIDFFKARKFLLDEILLTEQATKENARAFLEKIHTELHNGRSEEAYRILSIYLNKKTND